MVKFSAVVLHPLVVGVTRLSTLFVLTKPCTFNGAATDGIESWLSSPWERFYFWNIYVYLVITPEILRHLKCLRSGPIHN